MYYNAVDVRISNLVKFDNVVLVFETNNQTYSSLYYVPVSGQSNNNNNKVSENAVNRVTTLFQK